MTADNNDRPIAIDAAQAAPRAGRSTFPAAFAGRMGKRLKRPLGEVFGLKNFGVNLTRIAPGGESAMLHRHSHQDEFIYIVEGEPTLVTDQGETALRPGMCAGFPAGGIAHQLVNRSGRDILYLEIGDRRAGDAPSYPNDDIQASSGEDGKRIFTHKDGTPY